MDRKIIAAAAILGMTSVILGAFGAHALKDLLEADKIVTFETGVRYQMYHALLLLFVGATNILSAKAKKTIFYLCLIGVLLFSGSIYLLATDSLNSINFKAIGFITPIGGLLLIVAWIVLFVDILRKRHNSL
ncbi:MAG: DUF423 domain-containing protein [Flavobacterium sp.]